MISAPAKPTSVAVQRLAFTVSRRISAAPMVVNIGVVKVSAVTSASGSRLSAVKKVSIAARPAAERRKCIPIRSVARLSRPTRSIHGTMKSTPNRLRKNATSKGCSSRDR